ncbi:MAG: hypothetical protein ACRDM1_01890 [Gaiellaceae bacterium]
MPTLRIDDPALLPSLLEDLRSRTDVVAEAIGDDAIRISILGSYNGEQMRLATYLRVRAWEAAQNAQGVRVHVELE